MSKLAERGFIHILGILILLAGIIGGVYFYKHPQIFNFNPKSAVGSPSLPCWATGSDCDIGCKYSNYTKLDSWIPTCTKTCKPASTYYSNFNGSCSTDGSGKCLKVEGLTSQNVCADKTLHAYGDSTCTNTAGWCVDGIDYSQGTNCSVQNVASTATECYWKDAVSKPLKTLLVIYDPILSNGKKLHEDKGWLNPYDLVPQIISSIKLSSGGYADYSVVSTSERNEWPKKMDGFRYDESSFNACWADHTKCHTPDDADYSQLWSDLNICSRISSSEFDEVFVYGFPYGGFDEYALKIPGDKMPYNNPTNYWFYSGRKKNIPDCNGKTVFTMGWNYERGVPEAVHSYGHRIENALGLTVGKGYWDSCSGHNGVASDFDQFTCVNKDITSTTAVKVAGCGNVHYPPNGLSDYDYGNTASVVDACSSWNNYPFTTPITVTETCQGWGCDQLLYLQWWMHHLPRKDGVTPNGNLMNWWKYIVDFDNGVKEANATPAPSPIQSPSPLVTPSPIPTPIPTPIPSKPDLVVTNIKVSGNHRIKNKDSFYVTSQNIGTVNANAKVTVSIVITKPDGVSLGSCRTTFTNLVVGNSITVHVTNCSAYTVAGNHTITATVDSTNVVSEINENNNKSAVVISVVK